jgi:hypothetical protein
VDAVKRALLILALALAFPASGITQPDSTCGASCGGGGYGDLPTCGPAFYGVTLYVHGYFWRCIHASPDHWVIVG